MGYLDELCGDPQVAVAVCDWAHSGRTLARALLRKLVRKAGTRERGAEPAAIFPGLVVFAHPDAYGGGLRGEQIFRRVLLDLGFQRCRHLFEFCSGPGYIGYSLLANGLCERLTLADLNPVAVEVARLTARHNGIEPLVNIYLSDALDGIPSSEQWDLVVGDPPFRPPRGPRDRGNLSECDPDWSLQRRFYASIKRFMVPGGHVVMPGNRPFSSPEFFEPMIRAGGGRVTTVVSGPRGDTEGVYYLVSEW